MAEEITNALAHCSSLFVIARNSAFAYKGRAVDVRQIGRELGVPTPVNQALHALVKLVEAKVG